MANFFETYQYQVDKFNDTYGTNFSFEEFETSRLKLENLASHFHSDKTERERVNNLYKGTLLKLYREYVDTAILTRCDDYSIYEQFHDEVKSPSDFVKDFEALMNVYRRFCGENSKKAPDKYGAWKSGVEIMDALKDRVNDVRCGTSTMIDKTEYAKREYLAGRMPLRKMRADLDKIKQNLSPSQEDVGRAIVYLRALDRVSQERSFFAKLNPFNWPRMYAEGRDYKDINAVVEKYKTTYPQAYEEAFERAGTRSSLRPIKESIDASIQSIKEREQEKLEKKQILNLENDVKENTNELDKSKQVEYIQPSQKTKTIE